MTIAIRAEALSKDATDPRNERRAPHDLAELALAPRRRAGLLLVATALALFGFTAWWLRRTSV